MRLIFIAVVLSAIICGYYSERTISDHMTEDEKIQKEEYLDEIKNTSTEYDRLLVFQLKRNGLALLVLFVLGFTVTGIPFSIIGVFSFLFRYSLFISAMFQHFGGSGLKAAIIYVLFPVLFFLPVFYICFTHAWNGLIYCMNYNKRIYRITKKQLQNIIKVGIIIILITLVGTISEVYFGTFFMHSIIH